MTMNNSKKLLQVALGEYGVTERAGHAHHQRILHYFKEIGHQWVTNDETAWCSAYANWVALKAGYKNSGKLDARSWLKVGATTSQPCVGDVVVFWRESRSSWKGHVGFYIGYSADKTRIYCLGGNQRNQVNIATYPVNRLLGFRTLEVDWEMK